MKKKYCAVKFRTAIEADIPQLQNLYKECFPVNYPSVWFQDLIKNASLVSIVADVDNVVVGIIVGRFVTLAECSPEDRKLLAESFPLSSAVAYIMSLGVKSTHRSKGLASLLLKSFVVYASRELDQLNQIIHNLKQNNISLTDSIHELIQCNGSCLNKENLNPSSFSPNITDYKSLIDLLNNLPVNNSVQAIYLHVLSTNYLARKFYENRGFKFLRINSNCYNINGKSADGCTYVLHKNGGFMNIDSLYDDTIHLLKSNSKEKSLLSYIFTWFTKAINYTISVIVYGFVNFTSSTSLSSSSSSSTSSQSLSSLCTVSLSAQSNQNSYSSTETATINIDRKKTMKALIHS